MGGRTPVVHAREARSDGLDFADAEQGLEHRPELGVRHGVVLDEHVAGDGPDDGLDHAGQVIFVDIEPSAEVTEEACQLGRREQGVRGGRRGADAENGRQELLGACHSALGLGEHGRVLHVEPSIGDDEVAQLLDSSESTVFLFGRQVPAAEDLETDFEDALPGFDEEVEGGLVGWHGGDDGELFRIVCFLGFGPVEREAGDQEAVSDV